ncbi:MAG: hypothetical protein JWO46_2809 [Nocardioidaceae bacterium]|nr:hypothetical protein [Nocardioidaceae bacterium]
MAALERTQGVRSLRHTSEVTDGPRARVFDPAAERVKRATGDGISAAQAAAVIAACDPIFRAADVGFSHQLATGSVSGRVRAILWEADPVRFVEKYPHSGVKESYGDQWADVHCLDYWLSFDEPGRILVSIEGWNFRDVSLELDEGGLFALGLAALFARVLQVP